jgi:predicted nucleic acid-binding protein
MKPPVWFVDTSSLISLAVDEDLRAVVTAELRPQRCVLLDVVLDELRSVALGRGPAKMLAQRALDQIIWLGAAASTDDLVNLEGVEEIQDSIRGMRSLQHSREHWAEAVAIHIGSRLARTEAVLLSEDCNARIEARRHEIEGCSLHKLLSRMVVRNQLSALDAEGFAKSLELAQRGPQCTADDFVTGSLGRVGRP